MHMIWHKQRISLLTAIVVLGSAVLVSAPTQVAANRDRTSSDAEISAARIAAHVKFLASAKLQGRRTGTPAADEAAAYIAKEFASYGLKPPSGSNGQNGYLQPFTFVSGVKAAPGNRFEFKSPAGSRTLKAGDDFMPLAFSASRVALGEVVFAGFGISSSELKFDSYSGVDPTGKIVLILRGSPDGDNPHGRFAEYTQPGLEIQSKTLKAREKGAAGVVFISGEKTFADDRLSRLRHDLNFLDGGIPAAVISRDIAGLMLAASGLTFGDAENRARESGSAVTLKNLTAEFKTEVIKVNGNSANVVGIIRGSDPGLSSQFIVIGAHYDHLGLGGPESLAAHPEGGIHHGADDNASGTAALLEVARVLSLERARIKRSVVLIAFCGEELGLLGSAAYTKQPAAPLESTVAMLNMDMVGRLRSNALFVGGVGTSPAWKTLLESLNRPRPTSTPEPQSGAAGGSARFELSFGQDGFGPSDHQSFYVRDIPVLFFFTGTHEDYHKPSDTADKVNAEGAGRIAQFVREITQSVANEPQKIAFTKVKTESRPAGRGFRVYLGTVPNYSDQSDGMKLDGVRPGSPAEKAGLRAGDFILRLGKTPVKNVYDYTYALGEMRPGEEVEVLIRRDGREMTVKLVPDRRQ
jgi:Zn-dependent M28 family amino/carboxypeptidase